MAKGSLVWPVKHDEREVGCHFGLLKSSEEDQTSEQATELIDGASQQGILTTSLLLKPFF